MIYPNFIGRAYTSQSLNVDAEALINWYLEASESEGAKTPMAFYPCPGFEAFASTAQPSGRGAIEVNGRAFCVSGTGFYELQSDETTVLRGTVQQDTNPATLATNGLAGHQVLITSGGLVYCFDLDSHAFAQVNDSAGDPLTGTVCGYVDGFFLVLDVPTSTLKWSDLLDGTSWNASDVTQRNTSGDRWRGMLIKDGEIWLFGQQTSDVYVNTGDADQPFQPIQGAFFSTGIGATFACDICDNTPVWFGQSARGNGVVYRATGTGGSPQRISDHGVEFAIQGYETTSDAQAVTYQDQGHEFFILSFPTEGRTWVWDAATASWHERGDWSSSLMRFTAYRVASHIFAFGKHLVQDRQSGVIYDMDIAHTTGMDGAVIRRVRRTPYAVNELKSIRFPKLQIDLEVGLGNPVFPAQTPQGMLRWSNDGGKTWSNERAASAGRLGQYGVHMKFQMLGSGRNRLYEFSVSDAIPWRIANAYFDALPGVH